MADGCPAREGGGDISAKCGAECVRNCTSWGHFSRHRKIISTGSDRCTHTRPSGFVCMHTLFPTHSTSLEDVLVMNPRVGIYLPCFSFGHLRHPQTCFPHAQRMGTCCTRIVEHSCAVGGCSHQNCESCQWGVKVDHHTIEVPALDNFSASR
jgi:hypothetical protein